MRMKLWTLVFLAITASAAWAQQELPPAGDGPMNVAPQPPKPDESGVYQVGPGIAPPQLKLAAAANWPANAQPLDRPMVCTLSTVIDVSGAPTGIQLARGCRLSEFLAPSIEAVKRSQFQPGTLNGKPVPVLVHVNFVYRSADSPAMPRIALLYREGLGREGQAREGFGSRVPFNRDYDKPPVALKTAVAEFSEEARRDKISGVVIVSVLVNEEGVPIDPRVEKGLGHGLDEKALEAALEYRFKPATKDGAPVAARISIEMSFRLY
jgi:TonB family protein